MSQQPNMTPQDAIDGDAADSEFPSTAFPLRQHHHSDTQPYWPPQRSFSTPNASQLPLEALDPLPSGSGVGEKKKNKLGYHRTPVACSHCRRRKIRCVPVSTDPQGRCQDCIRLKKECSFIPADPQQAADSRSTIPPQDEPAITSGASSPGVGNELDIRSLRKGYSSTANLSHPTWSQPIGATSNREPAYGPIADVGSHQSSYAMNSSNAPHYLPSGMPAYPYAQVGMTDASGGWDGQLGSHKDEYSQAHSFSAMYAPSIPSDSGPWGHSVPIPVRSMSYSGAMPEAQTHAPYEPARRPTAMPDISHHGIAARMPISGSYTPVVASQLPSQGVVLPEHQQQRQYQDGDTSYGDWVYVQSDHGHDTPYYQSS